MILVVSIAALVFGLGLYVKLDKSEPDTATSDPPLLDEKTVIDMTFGFLALNITDPKWELCTGEYLERFDAEYVGEDIWVVKVVDTPAFCTFTVHDKEAHVILPR